MATTPIALCMIVRDGEKTLKRCLSAARPHVAEANIVLDSRSADGTHDLLTRLAAGPGAPIRVKEQARWGGFAAARNSASVMVSRGIDWVIDLDADEVIRGGRYLGQLAAECDRLGRVGCHIARNYNDSPEPGGPDQVDTHLRLVRRDSGRWIGAAVEEWRFDAAEESDDVLLAHPAKVHVYHLRRRPDPYWHMPAVWRADPDRTPLRNWKAAEFLAWTGDAEGAAEALRAELRRTANDPITGTGPRQRHRLTANMRLYELCLQMGAFGEGEALYRQRGNYLERWYEAADRGEAPSPDRFGRIWDAMRQEIPLPAALAIDPRIWEPVEREWRAAWAYHVETRRMLDDARHVAQHGVPSPPLWPSLSTRLADALATYATASVA